MTDRGRYLLAPAMPFLALAFVVTLAAFLAVDHAQAWIDRID